VNIRVATDICDFPRLKSSEFFATLELRPIILNFAARATASGICPQGAAHGKYSTAENYFRSDATRRSRSAILARRRLRAARIETCRITDRPFQADL
jgi:hypothetical protein